MHAVAAELMAGGPVAEAVLVDVESRVAALEEVVIEPQRVFELLERLSALDDPERPSFTIEEIEALEELTVALETGEANVRLVADLILDGQYRPIVHTLLAALQAAGSDEAQGALAEIAAQPGLAESERVISFCGNRLWV